MMPHNLREVRKAIGMTQQQMAHNLLLSTKLYSAYECGTRSIIEQQRLQRLLIQSLREHQAKCEQLKIVVAGLKCSKKSTNESL